MRRSARVATALSATALLLPVGMAIGVGPAAADSTVEVASNGAYFWAKNVNDVQGYTPQTVGLDPAQADSVEARHLPVAVAEPNSADKFSLLQFAFSLPVGATVTKATLTVPLADSSTSNFRSPNAGPDKVVACQNDGAGFYDQDGAATAGAPEQKCDVFKAPATQNKEGTVYTFDITGLVQSWADENNGVMLYPADLTQPFQLVFKPAENAKLSYQYTVTAAVDDVTDPVDTGSDVAVPALPAPPTGGGFDPGTPSVALPQPEVAPAPTERGPQVAPMGPALRRVALSQAPGAPAAGFWLAAVGGALLLLLVSLVLGDQSTPAVATANGRVSRALAQRRRQAFLPRHA